MRRRLTRREALGTVAGVVMASTTRGSTASEAGAAGRNTAGGGFKLATFSADVTPPLGHPLLIDLAPEAAAVDDPLSAVGFVLFGADKPVVVVCVDWMEIRNDAYDRWRTVLAEAAGTEPVRVLVSCLHSHDTPTADLEAQRILQRHQLKARVCDLDFHERAVQSVARAVREGLSKARRVTHVGVGQAQVQQVASNRRYVGQDGKPRFDRGSATTDAYAREQPENTIDPWLKALSFWDTDEPLAVLTAYATHPQSYYRTGRVTPDFPGIARNRFQADHPTMPVVHATGAGGNVTAGKYNDGNPANRAVLADRVYRAMSAAWKATERHPLQRAEFRSAPLRLEPRVTAGFTQEDLEQGLTAEAGAKAALAALGLSWRKRVAAGQPIDVPALDLGPAQVLLLPAEVYVEFQLYAQQLRPDSFVVVLGYGECAPGYIPIERAWDEGDGNLGVWCWVARGSESKLKAAIDAVLRPKN